jgi:hypothetical protein
MDCIEQCTSATEEIRGKQNAMFHHHQLNLDVNTERVESLQRNAALMAEALTSTVGRLLDEEFGGYRSASIQEMEQFLDELEATLKN